MVTGSLNSIVEPEVGCADEIVDTGEREVEVTGCIIREEG